MRAPLRRRVAVGAEARVRGAAVVALPLVQVLLRHRVREARADAVPLVGPQEHTGGRGMCGSLRSALICREATMERSLGPPRISMEFCISSRTTVHRKPSGGKGIRHSAVNGRLVAYRVLM